MSGRVLLDDETRALLEAVSAFARRGRGGGPEGGSRRGLLKGGDEEFSDYRPYAPGDDLRRIDWKPFMRHGELYVKLFSRSSAGEAHVLLDASASMGVGEAKALCALRTAAALGYYALSRSDRLFVWTLRDGEAEKAGPFQTKRAARGMLEFLEGVEFGGRTDLASSLAASLGKRPGRPEGVLVSDLWDESDYFGVVAALRARGVTLTAVQVMDRLEYRPDPLGAARLEDAESGGALEGWVGEETAARYASLFSARFEELGRRFRALRTAHEPARADEPLRDLVLRLLRA